MLYQAEIARFLAFAETTEGGLTSLNIFDSAITRLSIISLLCNGPGVMRSRSVPFGTVGKLIGWM